MTVTLKRYFQTEDLETLWKVAFSDPDAEWHKWNGPYFNDKVPTLEEMRRSFIKQGTMVANPLSMVFGSMAFWLGCICALRRWRLATRFWI